MSCLQQANCSALGRTIHVAPLHPKLSDEVLRTIFTKHCGPVSRIALIDGRQSGLIEFETKEAAEKAIKLKGTKLTEANFDFTVHPEATTNTIDKGRSDASRTVYIPCFPAGIDIVPFFEKRCGPVQQCSTKITACAYGFVEFESVTSVDRALNSMVGQEFSELGDSALKIRPAKTSIQHFPNDNPFPPRTATSAPTSLPPPVGFKPGYRASPSSLHKPVSPASHPAQEYRKVLHPQSSPALSRTIHVAPLRPTLKEETLCAVFQGICGPVVRGFLVDGRQSGLVEFAKAETATEALKLKGVQFTDGHLTFTLHPEPTTNTIGPKPGPRAAPHTHRTIYIPCFPANMDLAAFFEKHCGDVSRAKSSITACAYGFVEFQDSGAAEKALELMGTVVEDLGNEPLKVTRAKTSIEDKAVRPISAMGGTFPVPVADPPVRAEADHPRRPAPPTRVTSSMVPSSSSSSSSISSSTSVGTESSQGKPSSKNLPATVKGESKVPHPASAGPLTDVGGPKALAGNEEWQTHVSKRHRQRLKHNVEAAPSGADPLEHACEEQHHHAARAKSSPSQAPKAKPKTSTDPGKPPSPGKLAGLPAQPSSSVVSSPLPVPPNTVASASSAADSLCAKGSLDTSSSAPQCPEPTTSSPASPLRVDPSPPIGPLDFSNPPQPLPPADALSSTWIYNLFQIVGSSSNATGAVPSPDNTAVSVSTPQPVVSVSTTQPLESTSAEHRLTSSVPVEQVQMHRVAPPPFIISGTGGGAEVPGIVGAAVHPQQSNFSFLGTSFFHTPPTTFAGFGTEVSNGSSYLFANPLGNAGMFESRLPFGMDVLGAPSPVSVAPGFSMGYSMRTASTPLADDVWIGAQSMASAFGGAY
eukprot:GGOE01003382.1.p1 GENE.GGOE01003382.1~~GGOE01003382.1.p1  ORF type:complete len:882 (-),score=128.30 GGOE01003382.1:230-2836(-)